MSEEKRAIILEQSHYCLRTILLFSHKYPIPVLLDASTLFLWVQGKISYHLLRTFLLLSPNCLITLLLQSYSALPKDLLCVRGE